MASSSSAPAADLRDNLSRVKRSSPLGTTLFAGIRTADIFIQYGLVAYSLASPSLRTIGVPALPPFLPGAFSLPTLANFTALPLQARILIALATASSIKHVYWVFRIGETEIRPTEAIPVGIFNTLFNSLNSIFWSIAPLAPLIPSAASSLLTNLGVLSPAPRDLNSLSPTFLLGTAMAIGGLLLETASEIQRRNFKARPENKGKPFTGGLFGVARHINYGAYCIWRAGYAMAAAGPIWGGLVFWFFYHDFMNRGIPVLDRYCADRVS
jgi:protein-S-isoprenylcysteine O-methyltransferase Ste14